MRIYITYRGKIASRVAVRQSRKSHPHGSAYRARQVNNVLEIMMKSIFKSGLATAAVCMLTLLCLASCGRNNSNGGMGKSSNVVGDAANDVKNGVSDVTRDIGEGASDITRDIGEGVEDLIPGADRGFQRGTSGDEFTSDENYMNGK